MSLEKRREDKRHPENISNGKNRMRFLKNATNEHVYNENSTQPCVRRACRRLCVAAFLFKKKKILQKTFKPQPIIDKTNMRVLMID